jgi:hypothetical protein
MRRDESMTAQQWMLLWCLSAGSWKLVITGNARRGCEQEEEETKEMRVSE